MLRNYIKIAIRNIQNSPVYSTINIIGLTIGIVSSLLLFLYVKYEMSYDKFHTNKDNIYRVVSSAQTQDTKLTVASSPAPMGPTLTTEYPEVLNFVRIKGRGETLVTIDEDLYYESNIFFSDSSFFSIFSFELLEGNKKTCLIEPNSIVLSKSLAEKYFPGEDAIGRTLKSGGDETQRKVTGVMADPKVNSVIKPNGLVSYSSLPPLLPHAWGSMGDFSFIILADGTSQAQVDKMFGEIYEKYMAALLAKFDATAEFKLMPLTDIHLLSNYDFELEPGGDIAYLYVFSAIAFFMLLIACINYMNLATARSFSRSKEVGIRKAMGSYKIQLMGQFITESIVIAFVALILSVIISFFIIPFFNDVASVEISQYFFNDGEMIAMLVGIIVFVGLVGGSYPAFYLSKFKAAEVLKGKSKKSRGNEMLRKVLVVAQFSISLFMVVSTWIVYDQLEYIRKKELGFNKEQVINISLDGKEIRNKLEVLSARLNQSPNIEAIGSGNNAPGFGFDMSGISVESADGNMIDKIFQSLNVDNMYVTTLQIPIVKGRNFLSEVGNDTVSAVMVNEQMVKHMGWEEPIGKKFAITINMNPFEQRVAKVVGVVKNFHLEALQKPIEPLVIHNSINNGNMIVRIKAEQIQEALQDVETIVEDVIPNRPFEYAFLDQNFQRQYETDEKRGEIFIIFSVLTIAIACLGLFGLASYTAEARKKEIGVRKVVGASITEIVFMMSKDFLKLVIFSIILAFPLSYFFMNEWLEEFAFRSELKWTSFLLSAALTVLVAFTTVLYHSIKSATANPSEAIRDN
jgi:putative ABC transport system permease protein